MPLGLLLFFSFANSSDTPLILRDKNLGFSDMQCILAYTLFNLLYALSPPPGHPERPNGTLAHSHWSWSLYVAAYFDFAFADKSGAWWLFPLYGLYMGLTDGVGRALIRDKIPEGKNGTAIGIFQMSQGFTVLAGSVVAGLLWDIFGPQAPFMLGGTLALAAMVFALIIVPEEFWKQKIRNDSRSFLAYIPAPSREYPYRSWGGYTLLTITA